MMLLHSNYDRYDYVVGVYVYFMYVGGSLDTCLCKISKIHWSCPSSEIKVTTWELGSSYAVWGLLETV